MPSIKKLSVRIKIRPALLPSDIETQKQGIVPNKASHQIRPLWGRIFTLKTI